MLPSLWCTQNISVFGWEWSNGRPCDIPLSVGQLTGFQTWTNAGPRGDDDPMAAAGRYSSLWPIALRRQAIGVEIHTRR